MNLNIFQVDAFTDEPFKGNPAGVCILDTPHSETWMLGIAKEMKVSETAFLMKTQGGFILRWFTPLTEVTLCGHATLASAHVLWEEQFLPSDEKVYFHTLSGILTAEKNASFIELDFPALTSEPGSISKDMLRALGIGSPRAVVEADQITLLELESAEEVRTCDPDFLLMKTAEPQSVLITSLSDSGEFDFISRFFAPLLGVNEDAVTGSTHCILAPYWASKLKKTSLVGYQASSRGGTVFCTLLGDRVRLSGKAVTVFRGELCV